MKTEEKQVMVLIDRDELASIKLTAEYRRRLLVQVRDTIEGISAILEDEVMDGKLKLEDVENEVAKFYFRANNWLREFDLE